MVVFCDFRTKMVCLAKLNKDFPVGQNALTHPKTRDHGADFEVGGGGGADHLTGPVP